MTPSPDQPQPAILPDVLPDNQPVKITGDSPATAGLMKWKPGQSGNVAGRTAGQVALIKQLTMNGQAIVRFWVATMNNDQARLRDRLAASEQLANRLWGKPRETVELLGDGQQMRIKLSWQDGPAIELPADATALEGEVRVLPPPADEPPA